MKFIYLLLFCLTSFISKSQETGLLFKEADNFERQLKDIEALDKYKQILNMDLSDDYIQYAYPNIIAKEFRRPIGPVSPINPVAVMGIMGKMGLMKQGRRCGHQFSSSIAVAAGHAVYSDHWRSHGCLRQVFPSPLHLRSASSGTPIHSC